MKKLLIRCPSCAKVGFIEIKDEKLKEMSGGVLSINIASNIICSHNFIVYIDNNLKVRDYITADFKFELPKINSEKIIEIDKRPEKFDFDIDLIKLNILPIVLTYIIKSIFLNKKIVIILDQEFLHNHIFNFFKFLTYNAFKVDITIIPKVIYEKDKKNYKNSVVFEQNTIGKNFTRLFKSSKLAIEKEIVSRFITELDPNLSLVFLRNEILKAYELSKSIADLINKHRERNENINILKINHEFKKIYGIKIDNFYLTFLIDIVNNYFKVPAPSFSDSFMKSL